MARSIKISNLAVILTSKDQGYSRGLDKAKRKTTKFGTAIRAVGKVAKVGMTVGLTIATVAAAALGRALLSTTRNAFSLLDATAKASDTLGIGIEKLLAYQRMASRAGISAEALQKAIQKMVVTISQANEGTGLGVKALHALGLSAQKLILMSPDEQLKSIADAMGDIINTNDRLRISSDLFGLRGATLGRILTKGREGFDDAERAAKLYGLTVSRLDASKIEQANDAIDEMKSAWQGVGNTIAISVAPTLTKFFNGLAKDIAGINFLLKNLELLLFSTSLGRFLHTQKTLERFREDLTTPFGINPAPGAGGATGFAPAVGGTTSVLMQILQRVANIEDNQRLQAGVSATAVNDANRAAAVGGFMQTLGQPGFLQRRGPVP